MSKVTVEQFLNAGFWFVGGDVVDAGCGNHEVFNGDVWNKPSHKDRSSFVVSLTPRPNLGVQPVDNNCMVEVTQRNGAIFTRKAIDVNWLNVKAFPSWKPSLKYLEQQMNDKQESAMNISERDIENAFIKQDDLDVERELSEIGEWVNGDTVCYNNKQLQEGCNLIYVSQHPTHSDHSVVFASEEVIPFFTVPTSMLSKPLTPEQIAAKEREEYTKIMFIDAGYTNESWFSDASNANSIHTEQVINSLYALYDAGYRK